MNPRRVLGGALFAACLWLLSCGQAPAPALRVAAIAWPGYEPLFVAEAAGYLPAQQIQVVEQATATDVMHLLRNRSVEAGYLTLDEVLTLIAQGLELDIILVADRSRGADAVLVRPPRQTLADLDGARVGVENTAVGALLLAEALAGAGLGPADIRMRFYPVDQHERAYLDGEIDALVTFEPVRSKLLAAGARQVFDSSHIPNHILDVLAVRREVAAAQAAHLRTLAAAHFRALEELHDEAATAVIARRWQIPARLVADRFRGLELLGAEDNRLLLQGDPPPLESTARRVAEVMHGYRLLADLPPLGGLANPAYLPAD